MKRRTFMLGVGAMTASGGALVGSGAFENTDQEVTGSVEVVANEISIQVTAGTATQFLSDGAGGDPAEGDVDFELDIGESLYTTTGTSSGQEYLFRIENTGHFQMDLTISYGFGADVPDPISQSTVTESVVLRDGGDQISPTGGNQDNVRVIEDFQPGDEIEVDLELDYGDPLAGEVQDHAEAEGDYDIVLELLRSVTIDAEEPN